MKTKAAEIGRVSPDPSPWLSGLFGLNARKVTLSNRLFAMDGDLDTFLVGCLVPIRTRHTTKLP
jgi:hypothetical protein